MQLIPLSPREGRPVVDRCASTSAIAGIVGCIGSSAFAQEALAQLNRCVAVSWWSIFRLYDDTPPEMLGSGSYMARDGTAESWRAYRTGLYRYDQTFLAAREEAGRSPRMLVHWNAREIPVAHREPIYTRHGLRERLSIVTGEEAGALFSLNLYRHEELPPFTDGELDAVGDMAETLLACVRRHLALQSRPVDPPATLEPLTRREREVCQRMLKGWTYDGIAADLGLSAGTVKTYRDRAFERLGIHHRNELFALACGTRPAVRTEDARLARPRARPAGNPG